MDITAAQDRELRELAGRYGISLLVLFGSQATGHAGPQSDVDIGFVADRPLTGEEDIRLNSECTRIFGTDHVDTTNLRYGSPLLLKQVADEGQALFEQTGIEMATLQVYSLQRYVEAEPLFSMRRLKLSAL